MRNYSQIGMPGLFSVVPILPHCFLIAIAIGGYGYLLSHSLCLDSLPTLYSGIKVWVVLNIILGSKHSALMPILALLAGVFFIFINQAYFISYVPPRDAWELIIAAGVGLIVTILTRW